MFPHFVHGLCVAPCSPCGGFSGQGGQRLPVEDAFFSHQRHEEGEPQLGMVSLLPSDGALVVPPAQTDTGDESCGGDKAGGVAN